MHRTLTIILQIALLAFLISCNNSHSYSETTEVDETNGETSLREKETPTWVQFDTNLKGFDGYIYTEIKVEHGDYIVWISYQPNDSTKKSVAKTKVDETMSCYSFDANFIEIGTVAEYDYLKGEVIRQVEKEIPDEIHIIPGSEGDKIANATINILRKRYQFNKSANRIFRHSDISRS